MSTIEHNQVPRRQVRHRALHYQPWTVEDHRRLRELIDSGASIAEAAALLQRTHQAVYTKAMKLGCIAKRRRRCKQPVARRRPDASLFLS